MKILVIGHARHGKDSTCEVLRDEFGLTFQSSSYYLAATVVIPYLAARGITYTSLEEAYADRVNHRPEWFDAIAQYNQFDPARFGKELFSKFDIYAGCRNIVEVRSMRTQKVFDACFWVDASERHPPEASSSMTLGPDLADFVIDNNGSPDMLAVNVRKVYNLARLKHWKGSAI